MIGWLRRHLLPLCVGTAIVSSACFPLIAHPTRVEPGLLLTVAGSAQLKRDSSSREGKRTVWRPALGVGLAAGFRDSPQDGVASRLAVTGGYTGIAADLYFELPWEAFGIVDAGFGVTAQRGVPDAVIPYVRVGRQLGRGAGDFGTRPGRPSLRDADHPTRKSSIARA